MALTASFPTEDASGNPIDDTRRIFGGMVAAAADGTPRLGVIDPDPSTPIVTGTTSMAYLIKGDELFVTQRDSSTGGVELSANDAVASVATTTAPVANSRIDVIWVKCQFDAYGDSGLYAPTFGVTQGTASATPGVPSIPAGATALAHAEVESTDVTTETVVITQVAPYTAMAGGVVPVRNSTELEAWEPADGSLASDLTAGLLYQRVEGEWVVAAGTSAAFAYKRTASFTFESTTAGVTWDSEPYEGSLAGFSTSNQREFTCTVPGVYMVCASVAAAAASTQTYYNVLIRRDGTNLVAGNSYTVASGFTSPSATACITARFEVGDVLTIAITSGASVSGATGVNSTFSVAYVHA